MRDGRQALRQTTSHIWTLAVHDLPAFRDVAMVRRLPPLSISTFFNILEGLRSSTVSYE